MTIDWWTLGIQAVNVVILIWLLQRFFWRPIAAMIEQRGAAARKSLDDAAARDKEAASKLTEIESTRAGFAKERETILGEARKDADQARDAGVQQDAKDAIALKAAAAVSLAQEKAAADKEWSDRASRLAVEIAGHLVARLEGTAVQAAFLDGLLAEIARQPDAVRQTVAANGAILEATSVTSLDTAEQERYGNRIGEAFGVHPRIVFKTDPSLLAGLELSGPNFLVTNSWRSDLERILADLKHD